MTAVGSRSRTSRSMSNTRLSRPDAQKTPAVVFAALGDATRLAVLTKLCNGKPQSISRLTTGTSRQAVTKHLRVLANAGVVRNIRVGRESLFELEPQGPPGARQ